MEVLVGPCVVLIGPCVVLLGKICALTTVLKHVFPGVREFDIPLLLVSSLCTVISSVDLRLPFPLHVIGMVNGGMRQEESRHTSSC